MPTFCCSTNRRTILTSKTLRALEDALAEYGGTVMCISHDRWFLDRIATHIIAFEGDSHVALLRRQLQRIRSEQGPAFGRRSRAPASYPLSSAYDQVTCRRARRALAYDLRSASAACVTVFAPVAARAETASAFVARAKADFDAARPRAEIVDTKIVTAGLAGTAARGPARRRSHRDLHHRDRSRPSAE